MHRWMIVTALALSMPAFAGDTDGDEVENEEAAATPAAEEAEDDLEVDDDDAKPAGGLLAAIDLPAAADAARKAGYDAGAVADVLDKGKGKGAAPTRLALRQSARSARMNGPVDNLGAYVQSLLDEGKRGKELAMAIREKHRAEGKGGKGKGPGGEHGKGKGKSGEHGKGGGHGKAEGMGGGKPAGAGGGKPEGAGGGKPDGAGGGKGVDRDAMRTEGTTNAKKTAEKPAEASGGKSEAMKPADAGATRTTAPKAAPVQQGPGPSRSGASGISRGSATMSKSPGKATTKTASDDEGGEE